MTDNNRTAGVARLDTQCIDFLFAGQYFLANNLSNKYAISRVLKLKKITQNKNCSL